MVFLPEFPDIKLAHHATDTARTEPLPPVLTKAAALLRMPDRRNQSILIPPFPGRFSERLE